MTLRLCVLKGMNNSPPGRIEYPLHLKSSFIHLLRTLELLLLFSPFLSSFPQRDIVAGMNIGISRSVSLPINKDRHHSMANISRKYLLFY